MSIEDVGSAEQSDYISPTPRFYNVPKLLPERVNLL